MAESTTPLEVQNPVVEPDEAFPTLPLASADPPATPQRVEGVGYILLASLLVALGGMVIPVLGWIAGLALVWMSNTWTQFEKRVAVLAPLAAAVIVAICVSVDRAIPDPTPDAAPGDATSDAAGAGTGGFRAPLLNDFTVPFTQELLGSTVLVLVLVNFAIGIALLVRAVLRRASR